MPSRTIVGSGLLAAAAMTFFSAPTAQADEPVNIDVPGVIDVADTGGTSLTDYGYGVQVLPDNPLLSFTLVSESIPPNSPDGWPEGYVDLQTAIGGVSNVETYYSPVPGDSSATCLICDTFSVSGPGDTPLLTATTDFPIGGVPEVAPVLGISDQTVKSHLHRIYEKTATKRQADLVKLVASYGERL